MATSTPSKRNATIFADTITVSGDTVIGGNLTVSGTTTTINTETINLADNIIVLNSNASGAATEDAGIEIERGTDTNVSLLWDEGNNRWTVGSSNFVAGTFIGALSGNASTASSAAKWTTARTLSLTGAVTGSVSIDGSGNVSLATTATSDPTLTLAGDVTGSATFTNLGNATLTATVANDSHTHDGRYYTESESDSRFFNITGDTVTGDAYFNATTFWKVSASDAANQRADARDDSTNASRLHWYGMTDTGGTSNFRHAWYDGSNYIYVTASAPGRIDFTGSAASMYIGSGRVFTDGYHPNADKWTTARTNTVTLTGSVTGTGSASVDGSGNWTVTVPTTTNHTHNYDNYVSWTAEDGDGTQYTVTSGDVLKFAEGSAIDVNFTADDVLTISHADTSSQASVNNSNGTVIQDVTLDGFGHVTGLASVDLDTRYVNVTGDTMTGTLVSPQIDFTNSTNTISATMLSTDTLSFSGDSGQLFSITDSLSGTIFAVNDISGVPSIEVDDDGTIRLAETFGNVLIGTAVESANPYKLQMAGNMEMRGTSPYIRFTEDSTEKGYVQWSSLGYMQIGNDEDGSRVRIKDNIDFTSDNGSTWNRIFHDGYHPNADKWTTARTNTVTLTGSVTGTGSASVDGSGNWTVTVPTTTNHTHNYDNYGSWTAEDGDGTQYTVTSGDTLKFAEGTAIDVNFTADDVLTISHADTSSQASVNNSNGTVIQDVTLDTNGHVTGLASVNLDTRYIQAIHSTSDFADGTLVQTNIPANVTSGASFILEVTGKSYTATTPPFSFIVQGYIYNDTFINCSGVNNGDLRLTYVKIMEYNNNLCFWWPRISYWNSFEVRVRDAGGGTVNRATSISNSTEPAATKIVTVNLHKSVLYDTNINAAALYSTVLYDSDDTNYYVNPNATSNINILNVADINRDPTVTLSGDVTGSATMTNLGSINITTTVANDSHTHSNYVLKAGDTMTGALTISSTVQNLLNIYNNTNAGGATINFSDNIGQGQTGQITFYHSDAQSPGSAYGASFKFNTDQPNLAVILDETGDYFVGTNKVFHDGYHPNADKWTTARTLSLTGDVTGSVSWDGSANASITTTVANDSHSHSNYLLSNGTDDLTGIIRVNTSSSEIQTYDGGIFNIFSGSGYGFDNYLYGSATTNYVTLQPVGANGLHVMGTILADTRVDAPIFYDKNNTAYYLDLGLTSELNILRYQTEFVKLSGATGGGSSISAVLGLNRVFGSGNTITLPASPAAGNRVVILIVSDTATDNVIARNGNNIMGLAEDLTLDIAGVSLTLMYSGDATSGWRIL